MAGDDIEGNPDKPEEDLPAVVDLTDREAPADLQSQSLELKGPWGIGLLKIALQGATIGEALGFTLLVGIAITAGYMVDRLAVSLAVDPIVTLCLALLAGIVVLVGGGWFVKNNRGSR